MNEWKDGWKDEWMNKWMKGWLKGWMNEWMNEWMNDWLIDLENPTCISLKKLSPDQKWSSTLWRFCIVLSIFDQVGAFNSLHINQSNTELKLSNQIKSNQIKSNQIKSNQIKSNQISHLIDYFPVCSNHHKLLNIVHNFQILHEFMFNIPRIKTIM